MLAGIAYNMATSGGSGGNTTTAEAARKVYKMPEIRDRLVELCPPRHKFVYDEIITNSEFSVIETLLIITSLPDNLLLRLVSSDLLLLPDKLGQYLVLNDVGHKLLLLLISIEEIPF